MSSSADPSLLSPPWGRIELPRDSVVPHRIGPRDHWLSFRQGEIQVATAMAPLDEPSPTPEPGPEVEWSRWALPAGGDGTILLRPTLPDRPVVLTPDFPFSLLPRAEARIFVRIPLWIRVEVEGNGPTLLHEVPAGELSDTWWGDFLEGELCYWLHTHARRAIHPELVVPHLAICPLLMVNRSGTDLKVDKLAFRVAHLSLFAHGGGFWADESVVRYQGDAEGSHVEITGRPPGEAHDAPRVAEPRIPATRSFKARTFQRLRGLPGLGGG